MKMITNKSEIKEAISILDVAYSLCVDMEQHGSRYFIRCPHHHGGTRIDRKIGNCYIKQDLKSFKCESCGNSGDSITLVMQVLNCSFREAISYLSELSGVRLCYANEGESYVDSNGQKRIAVKVISLADQTLIGLHNDPVYKSVSTLDSEDYLEAKKCNSEAVLDIDGNVKYYIVKELVESNPLYKLASTDIQSYRNLVKNKVWETYHTFLNFAKVFTNTGYEIYAQNEIISIIRNLQRIYSEVGGNPHEIRLPVKELKVEIDYAEVPF